MILNFNFDISLFICFSILPSGSYVTLYMRECSHYEMRENNRHLSCGFSETVHVIVKMPRSCCVDNCSNIAKPQPNLNFFDKIQSNMHQIFTQMYLTVSIGPSHMEIFHVTGDFHTSPSHTNSVSRHLTIEPLFLLLPRLFLMRTLQASSKRYTRFQQVLKASSYYISAWNKIGAPFPPKLGLLLNIHAVSIDLDVPP